MGAALGAWTAGLIADSAGGSTACSWLRWLRLAPPQSRPGALGAACAPPLGQERKESIQMLQEPLTEGSSYRLLVGLFCSYCPAWGTAPIWRIRLNSSSMVHDSAILPPSMR